MFLLCLCSLYLASFISHNEIMRHFRVRKLYHKIYALCHCYGWANMLVITQHFVQPCKETEISLRLTDIHLLHCYFCHIIGKHHIVTFFFPKKITLSMWNQWRSSDIKLQSRPKVVGTLEPDHVSPFPPNQCWKISRFFQQKVKKITRLSTL